ncbi:PadR family transcriptional regulator [Streptomyces sp. B6B3]|uniref:PadR family transcriptional regulator n=1 Tax=Streptomyces sp. B6B3 TaxID=3153570 RepID=UPI00325D73A6
MGRPTDGHRSREHAIRTLTPLAVACLAVLVERPMHPYELFSLLRERHADSIVKVNPGSLYHTVERLARHGLAEPVATERAGNRPERTTYAITPAGRAALVASVSDMLGAPVNEYPQFPLALGEAHNLPREQVIGHLEDRAERLEAMLREADALIDEVSEAGVPEAYWFVVDYRRTVQTAELAWIRSLTARLHSKEFPWPLETTTRP